MRYDYKVVPAPDRGEKTKGVKGPEGRFAAAVERIMNDMAERGWEYLRTDTLPSEERAGLTQTVTVWRNLLIFRRQNAADVSSFAPRMLTAPLVLDRPVVAGRVPQEAEAARTAAALSPRRVERPVDVAARAVAPALPASEALAEEDEVADVPVVAREEAPATAPAPVVAPEPVAAPETKDVKAEAEPTLDPRIAEPDEAPQRVSSARAEALKSVSPDDVERGIWGDAPATEAETAEMASDDMIFAESENLDDDVWDEDDTSDDEDFEEDLWGHQAAPEGESSRDEFASLGAAPDGDDLWDDDSDETAEAGSDDGDEEEIEEDLWGKAARPAEDSAVPLSSDKTAPGGEKDDTALTAAANTVALQGEEASASSDQDNKADLPQSHEQAKVEDAPEGEDSIDGLLARLRLEMEPTGPAAEEADLGMSDVQPPAVAADAKDAPEVAVAMAQAPEAIDAPEGPAKPDVDAGVTGAEEASADASEALDTESTSGKAEVLEAEQQASETTPKSSESAASPLRPRRPQAQEQTDTPSDEDAEAARLRMARKKRKRMEAKAREGQPVRNPRKVTVGENRIVSRGKVPSVAQRDPDGDNGVEDTGTVHSLPGALAARAARLKSAAGQN